nr:zinc finger protein OZF isoform X3 [Odocoileus virginianus texanus]
MLRATEGRVTSLCIPGDCTVLILQKVREAPGLSRVLGENFGSSINILVLCHFPSSRLWTDQAGCDPLLKHEDKLWMVEKEVERKFVQWLNASASYFTSVITLPVALSSSPIMHQ